MLPFIDDTDSPSRFGCHLATWIPADVLTVHSLQSGDYIEGDRGGRVLAFRQRAVEGTEVLLHVEPSPTEPTRLLRSQANHEEFAVVTLASLVDKVIGNHAENIANFSQQCLLLVNSYEHRGYLDVQAQVTDLELSLDHEKSTLAAVTRQKSAALLRERQLEAELKKKEKELKEKKQELRKDRASKKQPIDPALNKQLEDLKRENAQLKAANNQLHLKEDQQKERGTKRQLEHDDEQDDTSSRSKKIRKEEIVTDSRTICINTGTHARDVQLHVTF